MLRPSRIAATTPSLPQPLCRRLGWPVARFLLHDNPAGTAGALVGFGRLLGRTRRQRPAPGSPERHQPVPTRAACALFCGPESFASIAPRMSARHQSREVRCAAARPQAGWQARAASTSLPLALFACVGACDERTPLPARPSDSGPPRGSWAPTASALPPASASTRASASAAPTASRQLPAQHPPARTAGCPEGMVRVEGDYCPAVIQTCLEHHEEYRRDPDGPTVSERCLRYQKPTRCAVDKRRRLSFCMDRYEYPNQPGELP